MSSPEPAESAALRGQLVEALAARGFLRTDAVRAAFGAVPRERFVPQIATARGLAAVYADEALVIQERNGMPSSSSSQPAIMAEMLEVLAVRPGHQVLEIGLGTGYNAALLSTLVGPEGAVSSVDIDETLVAKATEALGAGGYRVNTAAADGRDGRPDGAPYDRIIVTASTTTVPAAWHAQLAPDGRLVVPLRVGAMQVIPVFARTGTGFRSTRLVTGGFMPLRDAGGAAHDAPPVVTLRAAIPGSPPVDLTAGGAGIARLRGSARRTLVGNLLARPRRRAVGPYQGWSAPWHTALTSDPRRQIHLYGTGGIRFGLVEAGTGGCCMLVMDRDDSGNCQLAALESFGSAAGARAELLGHLRAWRDAGSPAFEQLTIQVDYRHLGASTPDWAARTINHDDQRIHLGWRGDSL